MTSPLYPSLSPLLDRLNRHITPLVQELATFAPFTGAVLFVSDKHHAASADAISVVNASRRPDMLAFTNTHVADHRVDLRASELGKTFATGKSVLARSRLYPERHLVYGLPCVLNSTNDAVVQLAFDTKVPGSLPSANAIQSAWLANKQHIIQSSAELLQATQRVASLGDALLLNVPTTPNAIVIKWDVVHSTPAAQRDYPLFRAYLNELGTRIAQAAAEYGAEIAAHTGDGQNIVLQFPPGIDVSSREALKSFVTMTALPLVVRMQQEQDTLSTAFDLEIRIAVGVGHVERTELGETTGPIFFELAALLKQPAQCAGVLYAPSLTQLLRN